MKMPKSPVLANDAEFETWYRASGGKMDSQETTPGTWIPVVPVRPTHYPCVAILGKVSYPPSNGVMGGNVQEIHFVYRSDFTGI